jgi:hypothetical protein
MPDVIYATKSEPITRRQRFRYAYEDDPTFTEFRGQVEHIFNRNSSEIPLSLLYTLWYETKSVQQLWSVTYSLKDARTLTFIFLMANARTPNLAYDRTMYLMVAWYRRCFPFSDTENVENWLTKVFDPAMESVMPQFTKRVNERNKARRGETAMKKGRPVQTDGLRTRITNELKVNGRSSVALLAKTLGVLPRTIEGALSRMKTDGQVCTPVRGIYDLVETN